MGAGIAVEFKSRFGKKTLLQREGWSVGHAARTREEGRYVFYLVTKPRYFMKPRYEDLEKCLVQLASWCELLNITALSMPRISCCRDRLEWGKVREMIKRVFEGLAIEITIFVN